MIPQQQPGLTISFDLANRLLTYLSRRPFADVVQLIGELQQTANAQQQQPQATGPMIDTAADD